MKSSGPEPGVVDVVAPSAVVVEAASPPPLDEQATTARRSVATRTAVTVVELRWRGPAVTMAPFQHGRPLLDRLVKSQRAAVASPHGRPPRTRLRPARPHPRWDRVRRV